MNILRSLLYFSIFKYPLTAEEIRLFSPHKTTSIEDELNYLTHQGHIYKIGDYYLPYKNPNWVTRRIKGNQMAREVMDKAIRKGVFISKFPYVEAVGISGALSKNYHDEQGDVDFFVITASNRLWIARTLLMLYKKVFLFNSRKFFCINYYVTLDTLEISEKNLFTATELVTLIPVCGDFNKFYEQNQWVYRYLPNSIIEKSSIKKKIKKPWLSRGIESILHTGLGKQFDILFRKFTLLKWKNKFKDFTKDDFKVALKSTNGVSKHHPQNFQKKVIQRLNEKYKEFEVKYNIELNEEHA